MSRKKKKVICNECENCVYIGEGDSICDKTMEIVLGDWEPTEHFMSCKIKTAHTANVDGTGKAGSK